MRLLASLKQQPISRAEAISPTQKSPSCTSQTPEGLSTSTATWSLLKGNSLASIVGMSLQSSKDLSVRSLMAPGMSLAAPIA
ncbi:hypothetical protein WH47_02855 [Habropoda laboriosa]|uniref:Uncharacterized protein n=1 Tax=Habropoda laboriosa TaxID=597456 RepID=A0A0L7RHB4_9HYME|nr:hypothetical protein WH47_02855 [Habropoda laboriosa]